MLLSVLDLERSDALLKNCIEFSPALHEAFALYFYARTGQDQLIRAFHSLIFRDDCAGATRASGISRGGRIAKAFLPGRGFVRREISVATNVDCVNASDQSECRRDPRDAS